MCIFFVHMSLLLSRKLMTFVCESSILNLVLDIKTGHLVAGTDEGIVAWTLPPKKELTNKSSTRR